jgi:hypothetical protein
VRAGSGVKQQSSEEIMKSIAAFKHLAVAGVASLMLCTGIGVANADNEFPGDKPIELVIH